VNLSDAGHTVVVDLGYGDAGKGTVVDWLTATAPVRAVIRFNGGAQAGHNVVTVDGRHHTFAQFGAGTLNGVPTHLSRYVVVDPLALAAEADHLVSIGVPDPYALLTVDADALLTTPWHRALNQAREQRRGADRHGSCGMGVGETVAYALAYATDAPRVGDVRARSRLRARLTGVRDRVAAELAAWGPEPVPELPTVEQVMEVYSAFGATVTIVDGARTLGRLLGSGRCVFEGAQGVLLDEWWGWHPYTTWSTTTFANAETLLRQAGRSALRLGVVRSYTTRHGPGPLVTEDPALARSLPEPHNGHGRWQGAFRVGHFDAVAHRYAVEVAGGVDALAVTHLDVPRPGGTVPNGPALAWAYRVDGATRERIEPGSPGDLAYQEKLTAMLDRAEPVYTSVDPADRSAAIGAFLGAPVRLESYGPTAVSKISYHR
jgi:adenylosuccinate synthase